MALAYSARFRRCSEGRPGLGSVAAAASSEFSRYDTRAVRAGSDGRGTPPGGIRPPRSLRTTFSQTSALVPGLDEIDRVERQAAGLRALVVAAETVLAHDLGVGGDVDGSGGSGPGRGAGDDGAEDGAAALGLAGAAGSGLDCVRLAADDTIQRTAAAANTYRVILAPVESPGHPNGPRGKD